MREFKREKVWEERYVFGDTERDARIREMAEALERSELFSVRLWNRGYRSAKDAQGFLRLEQGDFHDPYLLADMEAAVDRILAAVERKEKITVYNKIGHRTLIVDLEEFKKNTQYYINMAYNNQ